MKLKYIELDVQNEDSTNAVVSQVIRAEGRIDTWVNNVGAGYIRPTEQATLTDVEWVMDVNFLGVARCAKTVLPHMRKPNISMRSCRRMVETAPAALLSGICSRTLKRVLKNSRGGRPAGSGRP